MRCKLKFRRRNFYKKLRICRKKATYYLR